MWNFRWANWWASFFLNMSSQADLWDSDIGGAAPKVRGGFVGLDDVCLINSVARIVNYRIWAGAVRTFIGGKKIMPLKITGKLIGYKEGL